MGWLEDLGRSLTSPGSASGPTRATPPAHSTTGASTPSRPSTPCGSGAWQDAGQAPRAGQGHPAEEPAWALGLLSGARVPARAPHGLASCLGYLDEAYFHALAVADEDTAQLLAARFFPWWEEGTGAGFWDRVARSLAWAQVAWRPATTEADRDLYRLVLDSFERAQDLDPSRVPPAAEVSELHRLLSDAAEDTPPSPTGIGFRRGEVDLPLPGGWHLRLPGYFHEDDALPEETVRSGSATGR